MMSASDILEAIHQGLFLEIIFSSDTDWDAQLDARHLPEFDGAWCASYGKVTASCPPEGALVKQIRELTFKKVYRAAQNADLAAYVSDDMGLIAQACDHQIESDFIDNLWKTYLRGTFPT
ncbi:hypothetical protein [Janthinobacterium sp. RB2R34]|uniref:hypothetical protein n=1 Tax=Janthinobacterium sp. RB2R34 TaxID=3424193 RepID=UPI003F233F85